ncbi:GerMN domain-containing protein [Paenibacillus sp. M1]|uniref:GerMN domain-containing protein n=1 Tax=Paenibacillus haidiansis TaxID=1574488 RepID=A0ABU7VM23_9BACL
MKKIAITGLLLLSMLAAAGCGQKPQTAPAAEPGEPVQETQVTDPGTENPEGGGQVAEGAGSGEGTKADSAAPEATTQTIGVYFTDDNLMELQRVEREITYTEDLLKYKEAFKALQTADPGQLSLWEKIELNSVQFAEGEVALDVTLPAGAQLGAGGESLAIDALKQTFFQFDEVKALELTVDGEKPESLMGHVDLEHPFKK